MTMNRNSTRRGFLTDLGMLSASAVAASSMARALPAAASEPIVRNGAPKFKFSVAGYSYQGLLSGENPSLTLADFIDDCAKMGVEGAELTSYYFPLDPTDEYIRSLKERCFRLGLDVSGTAVGNDFCDPPGPERDKQIADTKLWIERADKLGAPVIRIFSGSAKEGQSPSDAHRLAVAAMEECCEHAGRHGIYLGLENHGGLTTEIDGLLALVADVQSPWLGVNLDSGNMNGCESIDEAYRDMVRMAPYAVNVQVKVSVAMANGREPSDFGRLAGILKESAYRGYIVLEYEEEEDPREACPRYVDQLREAFE